MQYLCTPKHIGEVATSCSFASYERYHSFKGVHVPLENSLDTMQPNHGGS